MDKGYIHSKETFGTVDGPGIRYVLFLQGCPMRCLYCHNPDTWTRAGGKEMTVDEVIVDYQSYQPFLKDGGLTLSGGEPLLQIDFVISLFKRAKSEGIHTALDTSGITFDKSNPEILKKFNLLIKYTDLFLLDIKHIDPEGHKALTAHSNEKILDFLEFLDENEKPIWIRHVIVPGITYNKDLLIRLGKELSKYHSIKDIDILPYHSMGAIKYEELGLEYRLNGLKDLGQKDAILAKSIVLQSMKEERNRVKDN